MANKKTPGVAKKKVNWKIYLRNTWQLYVMMLIPIIWLICFKYKPMLYIVVAFKKYNIFKGIWESPWVGFKYFKEAFGSSEFWFAVKNTLILNIGDLIIGFPFPIFLALFLNELRSTGVRKMTQIVLYLPNFLSWVIIAGISTQLFSGNGLLNGVLGVFGLPTVPFLTNTIWWRIIYWVMGIWQSAGYSLIIYLAALMTMMTGFLILGLAAGKVSYLFETMNRLRESFPIDSSYLTVLVKIIGITYIGQFSSAICKDAGYQMIGTQIDLFCKLSVMVLSMPVLLAILDTISEFMI